MQTTYLSDFHSIRPRFEGSQETAIRILSEIRLAVNPTLNRAEVEARIQKYGKANDSIKTRGTEIPDFLHFQDESIQPILFSNGKIADLKERMGFYRTATQRVFDQWYPANQADRPNHLIHVTCTGYISPNPAHAIAGRWTDAGHATEVTNAYHMGCYAALPALRMARGFCQQATPDQPITTDIAHTEICTLHFDPTTLAAEQIIVQSLFADGHIRYRIGTDRPNAGFEICSLVERTLPNTLNHMTWEPGPQAFQMTLSKEIPFIVAPQLPSFVDQLLDSAKVDRTTSDVIFAIHPGGPKIIEGVEMILDLNENQSTESHEILASHGNMSSATLPHIWDRILKNPKRQSGAVVVSLGFGPGLTMSGAVFRLCRT